MTDLRPHLIVDRFVDIDFGTVGRPFLIVDVDNTIAPIDVTAGLLTGVEAHLREAREAGALRGVCLVSNVFIGREKRRRVERFARQLNAHCVMPDVFHLKPHPAPFLEALRCLGASCAETVVVGDQLYTDVRGGNRLDMVTIYVRPAGPDHWTTGLTLRRVRERRLLAQWGERL